MVRVRARVPPHGHAHHHSHPHHHPHPLADLVADFIGNPASTFSGNIARVRAHSLGMDAASNILTTASEQCLGVTRTGA